jgi:hypothetical protein
MENPMLTKTLLASAVLALGMSAASACEYNKSAATPVPPVAAAPVQSTIPDAPKQDVAEAPAPKPDVKTN